MKVKFLIIRFSSIGDIVLTTPVVRCLKKQVEGEVEIHYLTKSDYVDLLKENPHIDKIHAIEKSTNEVIERLKKEAFDYVIDLHKNLRSNRVKRKLNALSFSFNKLNIEKWLLVNLKMDRMPDIHIVDRYLDSCKAFGVKNDGEGLDFYLPKNFNNQIELPESFNNGYIALVIGANHNTKRLPTDRLKELVNEIKQPIVLIGGKKDEEIANELLTNNNSIYSAVGKADLMQSAYLIKESDLVISPDTGMMHIAAAFQKEIISVWGNTVPELGMYPYFKAGKNSNSKIFEVKGLKCRPCSKIGFDKCPKGHFNCMNQIPLEEIAESVTLKIKN